MLTARGNVNAGFKVLVNSLMHAVRIRAQQDLTHLSISRIRFHHQSDGSTTVAVQRVCLPVLNPAEMFLLSL
jgi:hypothetical protein